MHRRLWLMQRLPALIGFARAAVHALKHKHRGIFITHAAMRLAQLHENIPIIFNTNTNHSALNLFVSISSCDAIHGYRPKIPLHTFINCRIPPMPPSLATPKLIQIKLQRFECMFIASADTKYRADPLSEALTKKQTKMYIMHTRIAGAVQLANSLVYDAMK